MKDERKTKAQLIEELQAERRTSAGPTTAAERQLAVERVRAEALAMRSTDDLHRVVGVMFAQMRQRGLDTPATNITFLDEQANLHRSYCAILNPRRHGLVWTSGPLREFDDDIAVWVWTGPLGNDETLKPHTGHPHGDVIDAWRQRRLHTSEWSVESEESWRASLGLVGDDRAFEALFRGRWSVSNVPFDHGYIGIRERTFSSEHVEFVEELAESLSLGYLRFLDFQTVEEQNRELTVQSSLSRVRAQSLSMQSSDELAAVAVRMWEEFTALEIHIRRPAICLVDRERDQVEIWATTVEGSAMQVARFEAQKWRDDPVSGMRELFTAYERGDRAPCTTRFERDEFAVHLRYMAEAFDLEFPNYAREGIPDHTVYHGIYFDDGFLLLNSFDKELSEESLAIAQRLTDEFGVAYGRFLELKEKEEQNRRLARDRAAERVRAEAMAMRHSTDLQRVVGVMYQELLDLDVVEDRTQLRIQFLDEGSDTVVVYYARRNLKIFGISWTSPDLIEFSEDVVLWGERVERADFTPWTPGEVRSTTHRDGVTYLKQHLERVGADHVPNALVEAHSGETTITDISFEHGIVGMTQRKYDEERVTIVGEFTGALSLGFRRFLDFEQLEEQNRALSEANEQIEQASLNKSQFLRRMSHDLRSPMNAIIGYTRLLQRRLSDRLDEREARNLANIQTSSGNLLNLINDILDLSRIEAGRIEVHLRPVDVRQLANECADALESIVKEGVALHRELCDVGDISSDADRLRQVVMNLLGNAIKFTDQGSITLSLRRSDETAELAVADTGVGIPPEDLPHIFDEFRQVERQGGEQREGTGLGLAIAKKTVDLLGGELLATSEVGVGTTFRVRLGGAEPTP